MHVLNNDVSTVIDCRNCSIQPGLLDALEVRFVVLVVRSLAEIRFLAKIRTSRQSWFLSATLFIHCLCLLRVGLPTSGITSREVLLRTQIGSTAHFSAHFPLPYPCQQYTCLVNRHRDLEAIVMTDRNNSPPVFDNILNFRDVAISVNRQHDKPVLRPGRIYRSARPDSASNLDKTKLTQEYGLKTIIDLRSKTEHIEAAKKLAAASRTPTTTSTKSENLEAARMPGVRYAEVNLNGKGFERHIAWQLSYSNLARLATNMLLGYRLEGISIISKNVLLPRGLIGLGQDTLQHSGPEVKAVFDLLANPESYPVLIHCTQGKDRTGLIVTLVLLLCDVDVSAISNDYTLSERELESEFEERMKEIRSIGLDESFAKCPQTFVHEMAQFIGCQHGSVEAYLESIGVSSKQINQIRDLMKQC